jgi:trk system potassium uptake protein TrkH
MWVNLIVIALIILGGLGFVVLLDVFKMFPWMKEGKGIGSKLGIQTKIVIMTTLVLLVVGFVLFLTLESNRAFAGVPFKDRMIPAFFQSVTARTAGFNTISIARLSTPSLLLIIGLMFIGASPGSTGGGIKTSTFCILVGMLIALMRNKNEVSLFRRTIPKEIVSKCIVIFFLSIAWISLVSFLLAWSEDGNLDNSRYFLKILFEVTSAFGTVGLSTGITSSLSVIGKLLIICTIFAGRVGPLTLALALALGEKSTTEYRYPEERVMVG